MRSFSFLLLLTALCSTQQSRAAVEVLPPGTTVASLQVQPAVIELKRPTDYAQLLVTATLNTGETADVTRMVSISPNVAFLQISPQALLRATGDGETILTLTLNDKSLTVPVTVTGFTQPFHSDYVRDVMPVLSKAGCNSGTCHGSKEGRAGFKLSLRGYDPIYDVRAFTDDAKGRRTNLASPDDSLMLLKATGAVPHEGQQVMTPESDYYRVLRTWIANGAKLNMETPRVSKIEISPSKPVIQQSGAKQQMRVVATYADGLVKDVTAEAFIDSGNSEVLTADKTGLMTSVRRGEAAVLARFEGNYASAVVTVMGDRTGFVWNPPPINNEIDRFVSTKLQRMKTAQSGLCTDEEFVRRIYLDLTGLPPLPEEIRSFLADTRDSRWKREALIDQLIGSEPWVEQWSNKWADLLQVNSKFLGGEGAKLFREWIRKEVAANTPYDEFVRKIITSTGSNREQPPASYFKILREPTEMMENTTHLFLATRFNCNKCHDHPFERWTQDQYYEMTAYFAQVGLERDPESGDRNIGGTAVEGAKPLFEKVVDKATGDTKHERTGAITPPKFPYAAKLVSLPAPAAKPDTKPEPGTRRTELANWITSTDNQYFAKSFANRIFGYLTGTGLIEPLDDIRAGNPASNPELLDWLTQQFVASKFNVRELMRTICQSRVYQLSMKTNQWNEDDQINYSHAKVRRLPSETLYDAIYRVTGATSNIPGVAPGTRAAALQDSQTNPTDGFLVNLGRPVRESACECERSADLQMGPIMALISGPSVGNALSQPGNAIAKLETEHKDDLKLVQEIFLRFIGRFPTDTEAKSSLDTINSQAGENALLIKDVEQYRASIAPQRDAMAQQREADITQAKATLTAYQTELAPKLAAAEQQHQTHIAAAELSVQVRETALKAELPEWEKSRQGQTAWNLLDPIAMSSNKPKAVLAREADRSIFTSGAEGKQTWSITTTLDSPTLTGVRLEALTDPRIPGNGPGRSGMGNFVLTEMQVSYLPKVSPDWKLSAETDFTKPGEWKSTSACTVEPSDKGLVVKNAPNSRKATINGPVKAGAGEYVAELVISGPANLKHRLYWTTQKDFTTAEPRSAVPLQTYQQQNTNTLQFVLNADSELLGLHLQTDNANVTFTIQSLKLYAGKPATETKLTFSDAQATYSQANFEIKKAIDGELKASDNGWAIIPDGTGKPQTAFFTTKSPVALPVGGAWLKFALAQEYQDGKHLLGKFRLSATDTTAPLNFGLPQDVVAAITVPPAQRTELQQQIIFTHYRSADAEYQKRLLALTQAKKPLPEDPQLMALKAALARTELPLPTDRKLDQLERDLALSNQQLANPRLTGAQDLAWALLNSPAFLFNH
jgi:hypothetical protein